MFAFFVRGLISATLLQLGLTSTAGLIQNISSHSATPSLLWYIPGAFALPLAFLLFTSSGWIYRLAFFYLAIWTYVLVSNLILLPMYGRKPPMPLQTSLLGIVAYSFPCVVALIDWLRRRRSNHALERTAAQPVE